MTQMLHMQQNVFETVFNKKKNTFRARRAISQEMYVPSTAVEIAYDEMEYVDGGSTYYYGGNAYARIVEMITGTVIGSAMSIYSGIKAITAGVALTAGTAGIGAIPGIILAVAGGISAAWGIALAIVGSVNALLAVYYTATQGGFKEDKYGFWGFSWSVVSGVK